MEGTKKLPITQEEAERLYMEAGTPIHRCEKVFQSSEEVIIDQTFIDHVKCVTSRLQLQFELQLFQLKAAATLYSNKSCILLAPTGAGKTVILTVVSGLLCEKSGQSGVIICCVPLNSIIMDKVKTGTDSRGYISFSGKPVVLKGEGDQQVELDPCKSEAEILAGNVKIVYCHPESLLTPKGRNIVKALVSSKKLLLVTHDEIQLYFKWGRSIREEMLSAPAEMRAIAPNVPNLYMTATFRYSEIEAMKKEFCVKEPCVVISCSPVLPQHLFYNLQRPASCHGFDDWEDEVEPSGITRLIDLLDRIILTPIQKDLESGKTPKKTLILCKDTRHAGAISSVLDLRKQGCIFNPASLNAFFFLQACMSFVISSKPTMLPSRSALSDLGLIGDLLEKMLLNWSSFCLQSPLLGPASPKSLTCNFSALHITKK